MENKLTAVQFLADNLHYLHSTKWDDILIKAKEMEKEQHECTCVNVIERILDSMDKGEKINSKDIFEQYYNQTFNK